MRKMLLTSAGFENPRMKDEFLRLLGKPAADALILFIPTAAVNEEQVRLVGECKLELLSSGISEDNIHACTLEKEVIWAEFEKYDAIYVCGGSTIHLLNGMKDTGFDRILEEMIESGKLYIGVSAGSLVLGPQVAGQPGLRIIDTYIMSHFSEESEERLKTLQMQNEFPVTPLTDMQALLIEGDNTRLIE